MRSIHAFLLLPLLLCACGGGGGGGGGTNPDREAAQQLLETCAPDAIGAFLDSLGIAVGLVDPNGTNLPAIQVSGVSQTGGNINWTLDLSGDPAPELLGVIQFADDTGQPAEPPFDITQFMAAGLGGFDQVLDQLLDGWSVSVTINGPGQPLILVRIIFTYASGAVSDTAGNGNIQGTPCGTTCSFAGAALADLAGAFPTLDMSSSYSAPGTTLAGATSFDGTDVVTVEGTVNGGTTTFRFAVDLGTGTVTPLP